MTGSATPNHKSILHSGTGRIGKVKMTTMSLFESGDSTGKVSLIDLFNKKFESNMTGEINLLQLIKLVVRGGWPSDIDIPDLLYGNTPKEYLRTVIDDDMFSLDGIKRDVKKVWALLHSLARNECTTVSNTTLRKDIYDKDYETINANTVTDYLNVLNRLFILDNQPAYNPNLRSSRRVLKSPKRHFVDPSLAVAALGATEEMLYKDLKTFGFLFESLCEHDLKIYGQYNDANLFHYRDERGNEVDAILELPDGRYGAFEIKLGANQIDEASNNLLKFKDIMEKEYKSPPTFLCVICGLSNASYIRPDGVYVVPITSLKY